MAPRSNPSPPPRPAANTPAALCCPPPQNRLLSFRNRQHDLPVHLPLLRRITHTLLDILIPDQPCELGLCLVSQPQITRLNERYLHHAGPTDVIAFDYNPSPTSPHLHGDIFICPKIARLQARQFRTCWQHELIRYLVHGVLHLRGHTDARPAPRRTMKRTEDGLLHRLQQIHPLRRLTANPKVKS